MKRRVQSHGTFAKKNIMYKFVLTLSIVLGSFSISAQNAYVPDDNLEQALIDLGYDSGPLDDSIPYSNVSWVSILDVSNKNISDMTGIEAFWSLISLDCSMNPSLTSLSLSANTLQSISANNCSLNSISLTNTSALTNLYVNNNNLSQLHLYSSLSLTTLDCSNNVLTNLDLSYLNLLISVNASNNSLMSFNIANGTNTNIANQDFNATGNPNLVCIQVDNATWSTANWANINTLVTSYSTTNCPTPSMAYVPDDNFEQELINLGYDSGPLDDLVPTNLISVVTSLNVANKGISDLTGIEAFLGLTELFCHDNPLTNLDVSSNNNLTTLHAFYCSLSNINLSSNNNLVDLQLSNNQLTTITLPSSSILEQFYCSGNNLTNIDVSGLSGLQTISLTNNQLSTLDLSNNSALTQALLNNNDLTSLNMANGNNTNMNSLLFNAVDNPNLTCIQVDNAAYSNANWLSGINTNITSFSENCSPLPIAMTYIPDDNFEQALIDLGYDSGPLNDSVPTSNISSITSINLSNLSIADLTGIEAFTLLESLDCSENNLTSLDVTNNSQLNTLICLDNNISSINISSNTQLLNLDCAQNTLSTLDFSNNGQLRYLDCSWNSLGNIDISSLNSLIEYRCAGNSVSSIDVSSNTLLKHLHVASNQLTNLNLTQNDSLTYLNCSSNQLTSLYVSNFTELTQLFCENNQITSLDLSLNPNIDRVNVNENNLTELNLANGNNPDILIFSALDNPNLSCIKVDDATWSNTNWNTFIDNSASFDENCSASLTTIDANSFQLYPNPVEDFLTIKSEHLIDHVEVISLNGQIVGSYSSTTIDLSQAEPAIYFMKLYTTNSEVYTTKIIKQ